MNKLLKRILIITGIIIGVLVLAYIGLYLKIKSETSGIASMESGKIVDNIYVIGDGFTNTYFIKDGDEYIAIDCGNDLTKVKEEMKNSGINPNDVTALFLTHTDGDHVAALSLFNNARLYMSKDEEEMINGKKSKFLWFGNSIPRKDYVLLEDGCVLLLGNLIIEGILLPGHTSGSMAYLINKKYLFTGDILSLNDGKIAPIPTFFDMDPVQAAESREIIRELTDIEYIFTAHWGYIDDFMKAIE